MFQTPLHVAALNNNCPVVKLLLDRGADLHRKDASGKRAIELAETNRSTESVEAIRWKMGQVLIQLIINNNLGFLTIQTEWNPV